MLKASYNVHNLIRRTFGQVPGGMFILCVIARSLLYLLCGVVVLARFSSREKVMAHPPYGSAQKERIRFALYCAAVFLRRFLFQGSKWLCCRISSGTEKGGSKDVPPPIAVIPLF